MEGTSGAMVTDTTHRLHFPTHKNSSNKANNDTAYIDILIHQRKRG